MDFDGSVLLEIANNPTFQLPNTALDQDISNAVDWYINTLSNFCQGDEPWLEPEFISTCESFFDSFLYKNYSASTYDHKNVIYSAIHFLREIIDNSALYPFEYNNRIDQLTEFLLDYVEKTFEFQYEDYTQTATLLLLFFKSVDSQRQDFNIGVGTNDILYKLKNKEKSVTDSRLLEMQVRSNLFRKLEHRLGRIKGFSQNVVFILNRASAELELENTCEFDYKILKLYLQSLESLLTSSQYIEKKYKLGEISLMLVQMLRLLLQDNSTGLVNKNSSNYARFKENKIYRANSVFVSACNDDSCDDSDVTYLPHTSYRRTSNVSDAAINTRHRDIEDNNQIKQISRSLSNNVDTISVKTMKEDNTSELYQNCMDTKNNTDRRVTRKLIELCLKRCREAQVINCSSPTL
ncbi:hypothetical protein BB561_004394 [Smittium simulii]|uniref:SPIN90/Ldb17 leucine-rich domain-containing protein n=1 Tax=Smittium simulii TaxID=133385 RepID=A0A2T9YGJ7_9FUNG|nr:hypothetical protein BB561_004394 [Smittium simulii]